MANKATLHDPYKYFLERYYEDIDIELEDVVIYEANKDWLQSQYNEQIENAKKYRSIWVSEAMQSDPAFMVDPINEYYLKLVPQDIKESLNDEQLLKVLEILDPITWAERNLLQNHGGFKARTSKEGYPYQAQMIRCKSKRIAVRAGRRIGKTISLVVRLLHKIYTWTPGTTDTSYDIVIFTPNQSQIEIIFKMIDILIDNNPKLLSMIVNNGRIPTRKTPYYMLEFTHGVKISGFVSGSTAIRGQRADILILDEGSFLTTDDINAVVALLAENKDVEFWISSTPKGEKDYFYDRCMDPDFVEFHFPSDKYHPEWGPQMEAEFRRNLTESGYIFEVLAEFAPSGSSVFQRQYVEAAFDNDYTYADQHPQPGWYYSMGVDWNDPQNGTQIYIVGYNPSDMRYRVVSKEAIHIQGWTQLTAVRKIRELNRKWGCSVIYVDYGHGSTQVELLHEIGLKAPNNSLDKRLLKAKAINFSGTLVVYDPWQKKQVKKPTKPYMVNNAIRVFEQLLIDVPYEDNVLKKQLEEYSIERITPTGLPIYKKSDKYGDHALDALMLALLGFHMEYSSLGKPLMVSQMRTLNIMSLHTVDYQRASQTLSPTDEALLKDKERERIEYIEAHSATSNPMQSINIRRRDESIAGIRRITLNTNPRATRITRKRF